ncbi:hypothetical protein NSQ91_13990 [Paenibacillus sp. FSL R7-0048]
MKFNILKEQMTIPIPRFLDEIGMSPKSKLLSIEIKDGEVIVTVKEAD